MDLGPEGSELVVAGVSTGSRALRLIPAGPVTSAAPIIPIYTLSSSCMLPGKGSPWRESAPTSCSLRSQPWAEALYRSTQALLVLASHRGHATGSPVASPGQTHGGTASVWSPSAIIAAVGS